MAAPIVSGVAGLMRSYDNGKTATEIYNCLISTANSDIYGGSHPGNTLGTLGAGRVDAQAALQCLGVSCNDNPIAIITSDSPSLCPSGQVTLTANEGSSYLWSTTETTQQIVVTQAGTYSVTVTFNGTCTDNVSFEVMDADTEVEILTVENSGLVINDGILCSLDPLYVSASYGGSSYTWSAFGGTFTTPYIPGYINAGNNLPFNWEVCVEVTDVGGCVGVTDEACANLQWLTPPEITIDAVTDEFCLGSFDGSIEITVSAGSTPYSFEWTGPNGFMATTEDIFNVTTGWYTIVVTDDNGCTAQEDVYVDNGGAGLTLAMSSTDATCGVNDGTTTVSPSGGTTPYSFLWDDLSSQTTPTATGLTLGTYHVVVTDNNGCDGHGTVIVSPEEGCCVIETTLGNYTPIVVDETYPFTINPGLTISPANTIANQSFTVNGTWEITTGNTLILDNCEIAFGPEAAIIVPNGATLQITNSHLYACSDMWDGIYVENGGIITVEDESLIEDATYALYIKYGADFDISGSTFNRNFMHIYVLYNPGSITYGPTSIINNEFRCQTTASLGSATVYENLHAPLNTDITYIGVYMDHPGTLSVGTPSNGNNFDHSEYGILTALAEQVSCVDNTMTDLKEAGIYTYACGTDNGSIDIIDNEIYRTPFGIICTGSDDAEITISGNRVDYENMASPLDEMTGIMVDDVAPASPNYVSITDNDVLYAPCGIHARNLSGTIDFGTPTGTLYIGENIITHTKTTTDAQSGILAENLTGALIVDNEVSNPTSTVNSWETGIRVNEGSTYFVFCNETHNIGRGLYFVDDVRPFTTLYRNAMSENQTGLYLDNAKIGAQGSGSNANDNTWDTGTSWSITNPHIMCDGNNAVGADSPFNVYNTGSEYYPTHRRTANGGSAVPTPTTTGTASTITCPYFVSPSFKTEETEEASPTEAALQLLERTTESETQRDSTMDWAARYGLYKVLLADMDLRSSDQVLNAFFQQQQEGSMGQLHRALATFRTLRTGETEQGSAADNLYQIQPQNRAEQRLKDVLGILYASATDLTQMPDNRVQRLRQLALLCPLDDGFAVHMARSALLAVDTLPRVYTSRCEQEVVERKKDSETHELDEFKIYPNPNNGMMTLEFELGAGESGQVRVYNNMGQSVFEQQLTTEGRQLRTIDLSGVSSGLYSVSLRVNGVVRLSSKVSIFKE